MGGLLTQDSGLEIVKLFVSISYFLSIGVKVWLLTLYYKQYSNMDRTVNSQTFTDYNHNDTLFDSHYTRVTQHNEN